MGRLITYIGSVALDYNIPDSNPHTSVFEDLPEGARIVNVPVPSGPHR